MKNGQEFAPGPTLVTHLKDKVVERLIVKRNCNYAFTDKDRIYNWGYMAKGLNFKAYDEMLNLPTRNDTL